MGLQKIQIQNLKCGGCAKTIETKVGNINGVSAVQVHIADSQITFKTDNIITKEYVLKELRKIGYPEVGDSNSLVNKATSYISCVMGKIS